MDRPTCETCLYWGATPENDEALRASLVMTGEGVSGFCRKRAPFRMARLDQVQVFVKQDSWVDTDLGELHVALFPVTCSVEWCGDHPDFPAYIESSK